MRVLVTGSRDWSDRRKVYEALDEVCRTNGLNHEPDQYGNTMPDPWKITVVEGGAQGADHWADQWCISNNFTSEKHPADWKQYGKRAGFVRNAEMVHSGIDLCLAFINQCTKREHQDQEPHGSHGATMAVALCEKEGIPVIVHEPWRF